MRVVIDANVLARAVYGAGGPAERAVSLITQPPHTLVLSPFIVHELRRVLRYPRLQRVHGFDELKIDELVDNLEASATVILLSNKDVLPIVTQDPDDDPIVATAVVGMADVLCTLDKHFFQPDVLHYCQSHGIRVLTDVELLHLLRSESSSD